MKKINEKDLKTINGGANIFEVKNPKPVPTMVVTRVKAEVPQPIELPEPIEIERRPPIKFDDPEMIKEPRVVDTVTVKA